MKLHIVIAWIGATFVILMLLYATIVFVQHTRRDLLVRGQYPGLVPMIYLGVLEINIVQEAVFFPA